MLILGLVKKIKWLISILVLNSLVPNSNALWVYVFSMVCHLISYNIENHNSASTDLLSNPAWKPAHDGWDPQLSPSLTETDTNELSYLADVRKHKSRLGDTWIGVVLLTTVSLSQYELKSLDTMAAYWTRTLLMVWERKYYTNAIQQTKLSVPSHRNNIQAKEKQRWAKLLPMYREESQIIVCVWFCQSSEWHFKCLV